MTDAESYAILYNNNNNNNNNNNVTYKAQIRAGITCQCQTEMLFESLPEGTRGYVCWPQVVWQAIPEDGTINRETAVSVKPGFHYPS